MATQMWTDIFPQCKLHNVISHRSDHYPILLKLHEEHRRRGGKEFRFENSWLLEDELENIVQGGWGANINGEVLHKLQRCTEDMNEWGRKLRNKYKIAIDECREELESLRSSTVHFHSVKYEEVQKRMGILLSQEAVFWKQRAKVYWLKDGDTNSRFFHAMASAKRKRNTISNL